jgi:hypothetical protein
MRAIGFRQPESCSWLFTLIGKNAINVLTNSFTEHLKQTLEHIPNKQSSLQKKNMTYFIKSIAIIALAAPPCFSFAPSIPDRGRQLLQQDTTRSIHSINMVSQSIPSDTATESQVVSNFQVFGTPTTTVDTNGESNAVELTEEEEEALADQWLLQMSSEVGVKKFLGLPYMPAAAVSGDHSKAGVLSPVVTLAKNALRDDDKFNKLRAKVISMHTDVISSFVDTSDTPFGRAVLQSLFDVVDRNHNGSIDEPELVNALQKLGWFSWLQAKQIHGIFERADKDHNSELDLNEWFIEAPKTLRKSLIKLAKKNGGELGLLV